jgi:DNA polymerase-3 subunit delta'
MNEDVHVDFTTIAPEGDKDLGIDPIRDLIEGSNSYPMVGPIKIILVDGVDRLTTPAANALLKTLEEPPSKVRFFLLAENYARVIPTIQSRCGRVEFSRLPETFIQSKVQQFESDVMKARVYARMSEGSVGRALRYWGASRIVFRDRLISLLTAAANKDFTSVFASVSTLEKELNLALKILDQLVHDLLIVRLHAPHMPPRRAGSTDRIT